jgi:5-methylthioadenosine/S-adenosylhomocysteine deaminase
VLIKNDNSPAMYPLINPYGSVVYQAGRGDVHTVVVNGRIVKHEHALTGVDLPAAKQAVGRTVEYARSTMGEDAWRESLTPELPAEDRIPNPYTYTSYDGGESRHRAAADESTDDDVT